jgi:ribosome-associated protein
MDSEEDKYIELNTFLKIKGLAATGGQAKQAIRSEEVRVNGEIEIRNKRKLRPGDVVEFEEKKFEVKREEIK